MKKRKRLSEKDRSAIIKEYLDGVPSAVLAERYGVNLTYPRVLANRRGRFKSRRLIGGVLEELVTPPKEIASNPAPSAELGPVTSPDGIAYPKGRAEARRLAAKGMPLTAIAAKLRMRYREVAAALDG